MDGIIRKLTRKHKTNDPFKIAKELKITICYRDLGDSKTWYLYKKASQNICKNT